MATASTFLPYALSTVDGTSEGLEEARHKINHRRVMANQDRLQGYISPEAYRKWLAELAQVPEGQHLQRDLDHCADHGQPLLLRREL